MSGTYRFKGRIGHSAPVIGDSLYLWGGNRSDLPKDVHDSPQKREVTSTVETFSFSSARWSSHLTRGTPPLGVVGYSCTTFRSNIYYYAGWCGHDDCYHSTLNVLNTLTMSWTQLLPNGESMMKKGYAGMISLEFDGTDYLFMVGGNGPTPAVKHPQFQYNQIKDNDVLTNEQFLYNLLNGQLTVPSVSGQCCPSTRNFTIDKINGNKGIMFGGVAFHHGDDAITNNVFLFTVTHNTIHWESVKKGSISNEGLWPMERHFHASAIINGVSASHALVVIGGHGNSDHLVNGCLLFDNMTTGQFSCKKILLPDLVTGRYAHSLTAVTMSPNCVWLVIVGGLEVLIGMLQMAHVPIADTNKLVVIVELVYSEAGEWTVQSVLDGNDLTSKKYQEKYSSYSKTRTWWMDQLMEYPTEREMKLQRYIQSLHQELQVAHQSKVSLQAALTETNKQGSTFDGNNLVIMNEKLEEVLQEKQILTEDNEKLRATVAYNEVYITEIEEEKRQLEEQYLMEKQITKGTSMAHPVVLNIHKAQRNLTVPISPSKSVSADDLEKVKRAINDVLVSHYATLNSLPKKSFTGFVNQLFSADLISNEVKEDPSMKECIAEFNAGLGFKRKLPELQEHCQKFLSSFIAVRGSCVDAAKALGEDWIKAINELGFDFNININT